MSLVDPTEVQGDYPKSYARWERGDDVLLAGLCEKGASLLEMSERLSRAPTAIKRRIETLGLVVEEKKVEEQRGYSEEQVREMIGVGINAALERVAEIKWEKDEADMLSCVESGFKGVTDDSNGG